jgi:hypothetical protein
MHLNYLLVNVPRANWTLHYGDKAQMLATGPLLSYNKGFFHVQHLPHLLLSQEIYHWCMILTFKYFKTLLKLLRKKSYDCK